MSEENSTSGGYTKAEWTSLSIQDRIRAMNQSIPDTKEIHHLDSFSSYSVTPEQSQGEPVADEEEEHSTENVVLPKRSSVVDIWRKRESKGAEETTSSASLPLWNKKQQPPKEDAASSPQQQLSPVHQEASPPKRTSVADIWKHRGQGTAEDESQTPSWKKRDLQPAESPKSPQEQAEAIVEEASPPKRFSVANIWKQRQQGVTEDETPNPTWKQSRDEQQHSPAEQSESPKNNSKVAGYWKQKQQPSVEHAPSWSKREHQAVEQTPSWSKRDEKEDAPSPEVEPVSEEIVSNRLSQVAGFWKQKEQQHGVQVAEEEVPSWTKHEHSQPVPVETDEEDDVSTRLSSVANFWKQEKEGEKQASSAFMKDDQQRSPLAEPEPVEQDAASSPPKRGSVADIWKQRQQRTSPTTDSMPPVASWKKRQHELEQVEQTPPVTESESRDEEQDSDISPPKRSSVADIWKQRQQGATPKEPTPPVPAWKSRKQEPAEEDTQMSVPSWKQPQRETSIDTIASWKQRQSETSEEYSPSVPSWRQVEHEDPAEEISPRLPSWKQRQQERPKKESFSVPSWVKRNQPKSPAEPATELEGDDTIVAPTKRSSVADIWNKRQQDTADEPPAELPSRMKSHQQLEQTETQDEEFSPPSKRFTIADIWKQRQGNSGNPQPSWKKRDPVKPPLPPPPPPPLQPNVANLWKGSKPTGFASLSKTVPTAENTEMIIEAGSGSLSDIEVPNHSSSAVDIWRKRDPPLEPPDEAEMQNDALEWPTTEDQIGDAKAQHGAKRTSVLDIWNKRGNEASTSLKRDEAPSLSTEEADGRPLNGKPGVTDTWKRTAEDTSPSPKTSPRKSVQTPSPARSWTAQSSPWKGGHSPASSVPSVPSWKKKDRTPALHYKPPVAPWVKEDSVDDDQDLANASAEDQATQAKEENASIRGETVPSWKQRGNAVGNKSKSPWVREENDSDKHAVIKPKRTSVADVWNKREGSSAKQANEPKSVASPSKTENSASKTNFNQWWQQKQKDSEDESTQKKAVTSESSNDERLKESNQASRSNPTRNSLLAQRKGIFDSALKQPSWVKDASTRKHTDQTIDSKLGDTSWKSVKSNASTKQVAPWVKKEDSVEPEKGVNVETVMSTPSRISSVYSLPSKGTPRLGASPLDTVIKKSDDAIVKPMKSPPRISPDRATDEEEPGRIVPSNNRNLGSPEKKKQILEQRRRLKMNRTEGSDDASELSDAIDSVVSDALSRSMTSDVNSSFENSGSTKPIPRSVKNLIDNIAAETNRTDFQNGCIPEEDGTATPPVEIRAKMKKKMMQDAAYDKGIVESEHKETVDQQFLERGSSGVMDESLNASNRLETIRPAPIRAVNRYQHNKWLAARADTNSSKPSTPPSESDFSIFEFVSSPTANGAVASGAEAPKSVVSGSSNVSALSSRASRVLRNRRRTKSGASTNKEEQDMARDLARRVISGSSSNHGSPLPEHIIRMQDDWEKSGSSGDQWEAEKTDTAIETEDLSSCAVSPAKTDNSVISDRSSRHSASPRQEKPVSAKAVRATKREEKAMTPVIAATRGKTRTPEKSAIPEMAKAPEPILRPRRYSTESQPADERQRNTQVAERGLMQPSDLANRRRSEPPKTPSHTPTSTFERQSLASRYHTSDRFLDAVHNMVDEAKKTFNLGEQEKRTFSFGSEGTGSSYHQSEGGSYLDTPSIGPVRSESTDGNSNFSIRPPKLRVNEGMVATEFVEESTSNMDALQSAYKTTNLQSIAAETLADMSDGVHDSLNAMKNSLKFQSVQKFLPSDLTPTNSKTGESPLPESSSQSVTSSKQSSKPPLKLPEQTPDSPTPDNDVAIEVEYFEEDDTPTRKAGRFPFGRSGNKKGSKSSKKKGKSKESPRKSPRPESSKVKDENSRRAYV